MINGTARVASKDKTIDLVIDSQLRPIRSCISTYTLHTETFAAATKLFFYKLFTASKSGLIIYTSSTYVCD